MVFWSETVDALVKDEAAGAEHDRRSIIWASDVQHLRGRCPECGSFSRFARRRQEQESLRENERLQPPPTSVRQDAATVF